MFFIGMVLSTVRRGKGCHPFSALVEWLCDAIRRLPPYMMVLSMQLKVA